MPEIKDMPDNYPWLPNDARYPMPDVGEAAVRLGSPVIYDRRGSVIWMDDFSNGLASITAGASGNGTAKLTVDDTYIGPYDIILTAGTTSAKNAWIWKYFTHASLEKLGLEIGVAYLDAHSSIVFNLCYFVADTALTARIMLDYANDKIKCFLGNSTYKDIATLDPFISSDKAFNLMKLVVDFEAREYIRFMYNNHVYDLSGIPIEIATNSYDEQMFFDFSVFGTGAAAQAVQVSHVIITAGEN